MLFKSKKRLALLFAVFLAVLSTGTVIVHQCHSASSNQMAMPHHHSGIDSGSAASANPLSLAVNSSNRLVNSGCAALFIVVLLLSRKYFNIGALGSRINSFANSGRTFKIVHRPQVFQLALSLPQLGVIRT